MRNSFRLGIALVLLLSPLAGCSDLATALQNTQPTQNTNATITVWTSDASPSYIAVSVDGSNVGTLTAYRYSAPTCGQSSAGAVSVTVSPGQHIISAKETSASGVWAAKTVTVSSGGCVTFELQG